MNIGNKKLRNQKNKQTTTTKKNPNPQQKNSHPTRPQRSKNFTTGKHYIQTLKGENDPDN